jgi:hypothetical protein
MDSLLPERRDRVARLVPLSVGRMMYRDGENREHDEQTMHEMTHDGGVWIVCLSSP